jgi:Flp pilus assembly protein TadG
VGRDDESGSAATELVIIMPAVMLLIMLVVQFALYYHGANVATAAAQDAVRAARVEAGSVGAGRNRADALLARSGSGTLEGAQVSVSRDGRRVHVEVTGEVASVIPGVHLHITRDADGPIEQFLPPEQR